VKGAVNCHAKI